MKGRASTNTQLMGGLAKSVAVITPSVAGHPPVLPAQDQLA